MTSHYTVNVKPCGYRILFWEPNNIRPTSFDHERRDRAEAAMSVLSLVCHPGTPIILQHFPDIALVEIAEGVQAWNRGDAVNLLTIRGGGKE